MTAHMQAGAETTDYREWIGRSEEQFDVANEKPIQAMALTLDHAAGFNTGTPIPPLWHWLYFLPKAMTSELAEDGHPHKGGFMPPIPKPRRMWAGSQVEFRAPMRIGSQLRRISTVIDVNLKNGRSGSMYFVKVRHEVFADEQLAVVEEQDIVYRDPSPATIRQDSTHQPLPEKATFSREIHPSAALLFRYSALTFNSHRIHYDRNYAVDVEGYAGLIVHGPLLANLMLDLIQREFPTARVQSFSFKAQKPLLDTSSFLVCGKLRDECNVFLWITNSDGTQTTIGTACLD